MATNWKAIKADFLTNGTPYPELAKKWNVSISTLKKRAAREHWRGEVIEAVVKTELLPFITGTIPEPEPEVEPQQEPGESAELVDRAVLAAEARANRVRKMMATTDAMMDRIIESLDVVQPGNTYALSMLIKALKDLREIQGLNKSALDIEEQQLRIEALRAQQRAHIAEPITVEFVNTDGAET